ncbi:GNAT family N-acetyltransferase [Actinomadura macrotermitis]|uniref:Aminoglycoside N(6')-acetyltransferase type 1 n=1 Tax=Actinomadura macrotermitis TaxID=2585200 RepID=A0A7K0C601_9ACTN|nr:GNAT family N-acetyltransferase [Actinomadura macrotermitis]MQY08766.1 Aminoglycoside N(6')-acetyltransferase type 1 [Actinomadura macrotermitis]
MITFRALGEQDFPLLKGWLEQPHVARWWNHETSMEAVVRDFGPGTRGEEPGEDLLAFLDGAPFGLVQRAWLADYPEDLVPLGEIVQVPEGALEIDYLIGDPGRVGRGLGTLMIRSMLERTWEELPTATCVIVPVVAGNVASWRALEKAGLRRIGEGELSPDNPIDDPRHYVYRIDRPEPATG